MVELEFRAVLRRFGDGGVALNGVDLALPAGRLTTVLGPSGCGKSTLLRLAAGLEAPTEGRVLINGRDVTSLGPQERDVGMLFQNYALFPHLDVLGNVAFSLRMVGIARDIAQARARSALAQVGLHGLEQRSTSELSGGQQQRVALARALVLEPSVLLLDEPLSNLDVQLRRHMREEIRALQQRLRLTMVYVTHDEGEAMAMSDFIVVMHQGRIRQLGTPQEVYERPVDEFVAAFMGDATIFDAVPGADGRLMLGGLPLPIAAPPGDGLRVMVRPESWRMLPATRHGLAGRVTHRAYLGRRAEYRVDTKLGNLLVFSPHAQALHQPGAPVSLMLGTNGVMAWASHPHRTSPSWRSLRLAASRRETQVLMHEGDK